MPREFNPTNPQAPKKDGYIAKNVAIRNIFRDPDTKEIISCEAQFCNYGIKKEAIFTATATNPILAYYSLLGVVEAKIGKVLMLKFAEKYETSTKNKHYITFWNIVEPEYLEYREIKNLIIAEIETHVKSNPEDAKYLYHKSDKF